MRNCLVTVSLCNVTLFYERLVGPDAAVPCFCIASPHLAVEAKPQSSALSKIMALHGVCSKHMDGE